MGFRRFITTIALLAVAAGCAPAAGRSGTVAARQPAPPAPSAGQFGLPAAIELRNRTVTLAPGIDPAFLREIGASNAPVHAVVQLFSLPRLGRDDVATLRRLGVDLLEYVGLPDAASTTYLAALSPQLAALDPLFQGLVRAVARLEPVDKLDATLAALPPAEEVSVIVRFFRDVPPDAMAGILARGGLAGEVLAPPNVWRASGPVERARALGAEDAVQWVEPGPGPYLPALDAVRDRSDVDEVQDLDAATGTYRGPAGSGVQIAVMDTGIDTSHQDFAGRIIRAQDDGVEHGTHVAGIAAGSGVMSNGTDAAGVPNGGTAFQFRGMAPLAQLAAYGFSGADFVNISDAINTHGADVSNHSYILGLQGLYDADVSTVDAIIRGDGGAPPRPAVWAAANNGAPSRTTDCDGDGTPERALPQYPGDDPNDPNDDCPQAYQIGYFSVLAPCKNCIAVASLDKAGVHAGSSSMGPTMDGRLKPEVSAVGRDVVSVRADTDSQGQPRAADGYRPLGGTSMAAPAVTGISALVLEQYAAELGVNLDGVPPLPSTVKAVLIQTAQDLVGTDPTVNQDTGAAVTYGEGPDWATGFGLVDADAAVDLVRGRRFYEGFVDMSRPTDELLLSVVPGQTEVRVTLAWDDPAGNPNSASTARQLVNDLDLVLVDPNGTRHRPLVLPAVTPNDCDPSTAGVQVGTCPGIDPAGQNYAGPAAPGVDRVNNVEQVVMTDPNGLVPGTWRVQVSALDDDGVTVRLPLGLRQLFSLAGVSADEADLSVTKTASSPQVHNGESVTYTVQATNAGPDVATGVELVDTLPAGVTVTSFQPSPQVGCSHQSARITCGTPELAPGETMGVTITVEAGQSGTLTNTAGVFSTVADPDGGDNVASATTQVLPVARVSVTKTGSPEPVHNGELLTYSIEVRNDGPDPAGAVSVDDPLPTTVAFVSADPSQGSCTEAGGRVTCALGTLASGQLATVSIVVRPGQVGAVQNAAAVTSETFDRSLSDNEAAEMTEVLPAARLALTATATPNPVNNGEVLTYTLTVRNDGPDEATSVHLTDVLPASVGFLSADLSQGSCTESGGQLACSLGTVGPRASASLAITVRPTAVGVITNVASARTATFDPELGDNTARVDVTVEPTARLTVALSDHPDPVVVGETLSYTALVANAGPDPAAAVVLAAELPSGLTFVSAEPGQGRCTHANRTVTCELGTVAPAVTVPTAIKAVPTADGVMTSTAAVTSTTFDSELADNASTAATTVVGLVGGAFGEQARATLGGLALVSGPFPSVELGPEGGGPFTEAAASAAAGTALRADGLAVATRGGRDGQDVTVTSSAEVSRIELLDGVVVLEGLRSQCDWSLAAGHTGSTTVGRVTVAGSPVEIGAGVGNRLALPGVGTLHVNEQLGVGGPVLTVNGVRLEIASLGGSGDIVAARSWCGMR
jgi:uncharacterized repeat protein (TIGR01451 family)